MLKFYFFKKKVIVTITLVFIIMLVLFYLIYKINTETIKSESLLYYPNVDIRRGSLLADYYFKNNPRGEIVITDSNIFTNPTSSLVWEYQTLSDNNGEYKQYIVEVFYLERNGINSFEVVNSCRVNVFRKEFDEVLSLAKKYDLYNIGGQITNDPQYFRINRCEDLSQEEIDRNRQMREEDQRLDNEFGYLISNYETAFKEDPDTLLPTLRNLRQEIQAAIKSFQNQQNHTFPDGSISPYTQENLELLIETLNELDQTIAGLEDES